MKACVISFSTVCAAVSLITMSTAFSDEPAAVESADAQNDATRNSEPESVENARVPLEAARARAAVMHDIYAATLETLHHRYFHGDRAIVPARAMQDIFAEIERRSSTQAHWISASMKPMSVDHEPQSEFERKAAKAIASGAPSLDVIESGFYRRAGAIPLSAGCIGCHGGLSTAPSKKPQFAALVISVPVRAADTTPLDQRPSNP